MKWALSFDILERSIVRDKKLAYTVISHGTVLAILLNLNSFQSPLIGSVASVIFWVINAMFLGNAFFGKENTFFGFMFGLLLLTMFLGFVGWLILIVYNLDTIRVTLVLLIVATSSSFVNRRIKHHNAEE